MAYVARSLAKNCKSAASACNCEHGRQPEHLRIPKLIVSLSRASERYGVEGTASGVTQTTLRVNRTKTSAYPKRSE